MAFKSAWGQWFPPESPRLTEKNLPRQEGKVFVITGGNSGLGYELAKILYGAGATVYLTTRSKQKGEDTIKAILDEPGIKAPGKVKFLQLDLNDLTTIKMAAAEFAAQESKLDVLWNNAGVANVPAGTVTAQGHEQHLGVNCVGPLLFTRLLLPQLRAAATAAAPDKSSVRVVWTSSWLCDNKAPKGGIAFDELPHGATDPQRNYGTSKCGNWLLAVDGARRWGSDGILSVVQNPGNLQSNAWRHTPKSIMLFMNPMLYKTVLGAYTELYAGLSSEITAEDNGAYVIPWGKIQKESARPDIVKAMKSEANGGTDVARRFWDFCEALAHEYE